MSRSGGLQLGPWAAIIALGLIIVGLFLRAAFEPALNTRFTPGSSFGGSFQLIDQNGTTVTDDDLRGKPTVMFFGYTFCPDVCPTTLFELTNWIERLGALADKANYVFVTVDPERDTQEALKNYLGAFTDRIVGLTGTPEAVGEMLDSHRIYREKVPDESGGYAMNHPASVFLLDAKGRLENTIAFQESPDSAMRKLRNLIGESGGA